MFDRIREFVNMLGNLFINFMCFLWITATVLLCGMKNDEVAGGAGLNGFLAFILWLICIYILIKGHWKISTVSITVIYLLLILYKKYGFILKADPEDAAEALGILLGFGLMAITILYMIVSYIKNHIEETGKIEKRKKSARKRGEKCCPRCGYPLMWVPAQRVPTDEFNDYEEGRWENDYSADEHHPTSVWVTDRHHDRIWRDIPGHHECTNCGYGSRS